MTAIVRDFRDGIEAYSRAWSFVRTHRLWLYMVIPGLISVLFGVGMFVTAWRSAGPIGEWIIDNYPWDFGSSFLASVAGYVGYVIVALLAYMSYKYVILVLVAPFMSPLSETVEETITGDTSGVQFSVSRFFREIWRGLRVSMRNLLRELFYTVILLLLGLVPVVGIISGPAILLIQAYFAGFGNMDYTLERHFGVRDSADFVRDYRGLAVANGGVFMLLLMVPIAGLFVAPCLATVAGALETVDRLEAEGAGNYSRQLA